MIVTVNTKRGSVTTVAKPTLVNVSTKGTQGAPGDDGIAGPPGQWYQHTQSSALPVWVCNHNFGVRPNVQVFSVGGMEAFAEVQHVSINQTNIYFDGPFSGYAIFS